MNIGENIRQARKNAGLTQKELGEKLGISAAAVGQFEKKNSNPHNSTVQKIAAVLETAHYPCTIRNHLRTCFKEPTLTQSIFPPRKPRLLAYFHMMNSTGPAGMPQTNERTHPAGRISEISRPLCSSRKEQVTFFATFYLKYFKNNDFFLLIL